jgi:hypothetical protein
VFSLGRTCFGSILPPTRVSDSITLCSTPTRLRRFGSRPRQFRDPEKASLPSEIFGPVNDNCKMQNPKMFHYIPSYKPSLKFVFFSILLNCLMGKRTLSFGINCNIKHMEYQIIQLENIFLFM